LSSLWKTFFSATPLATTFARFFLKRLPLLPHLKRHAFGRLSRVCEPLRARPCRPWAECVRSSEGESGGLLETGSPAGTVCVQRRGGQHSREQRPMLVGAHDGARAFDADDD
jgi:hypothetical protein